MDALGRVLGRVVLFPSDFPLNGCAPRIKGNGRIGRMAPKDPFVAIVYFTDEEHAILQAYFGAVATQFEFVVSKKPIYLYEATRNVPVGGPKFFLMNGLRAPNDAKDFAWALSNYAKPCLVVNIGTAGRLEDDLKLGAIVVPSRILAWEDDGSITDSADSVVLSTMAKHVQVPNAGVYSSHFSSRSKEQFQMWQDECKSLHDSLSAQLSRTGIDVDVPPSLIPRGLATGGVVVKSKTLKAQIKQIRGLSAVEMESYALVTAFDNSGIPFIALRGITDPATEAEKQMLDRNKVEVEGLRVPIVHLYALSSAAALLKYAINDDPDYVKARLNMTDPTRGQIGDHLSDHVRNLTAHELTELIKGYGRYFSAVLCGDPESSVLPDLFKQIRSASGHLKLSGSPGSGKSSLLGCLYHYHFAENLRDASVAPACYLDLQHYSRNGNVYQLQSDLGLVSTRVASSQRASLYLDGLGLFEQDVTQLSLLQTIKSFLQKNPHVKLVAAVSVSDKKFGLTDTEVRLSLILRELVNIQPLKRDDMMSQSLLDEFCKIPCGESLLAATPEDLCKWLERFDFKEVDVFTLHLLRHHSVASSLEDDESTLGSLYFEYTVDAIGKLCDVDRQQAESFLRGLCALVFAQESGTPLDEEGQRLLQDSKFRKDALVQFAYQHYSMRQFLIAEYVVYACRDPRVGELLSRKIFNYGINRFLKSLVNRSQRVRKEVFQSILSTIRENPDRPLAQAHLAYLLGRLNLNPQEERTAINHLKNYLSAAEQKYSALTAEVGVEDSGYVVPDLQWQMLLLRTLYVSLVYRGDMFYAEQYVQRLLNDPEWDSLNRGFHLQYYGDIKSDLYPDNMVAMDTDLQVVPDELVSVLITHVSGYLKKRVFLARSLVELHTLLSLTVDRHLAGTLPNKLRQSVLTVATDYVQVVKEKIPEFYRGYVELSVEILNADGRAGLEIVSSVLSLKEQVRSGWLFNGVRRGKKVVRDVRRSMRFVAFNGPQEISGCQPESVADHSWACCLLAWMFLGRDRTIDVDKVIKMLLIHDLPEIETGDLVSGAQTDRADSVSRKIGAIGYLGPFRGAADWTELIDEMHRGDSIESKLAKDIDRIERFLQARRYLDEDASSISDPEDWRPDELQTAQGKEILESCEKWLEMK